MMNRKTRIRKLLPAVIPAILLSVILCLLSAGCIAPGQGTDEPGENDPRVVVKILCTDLYEGSHRENLDPGVAAAGILPEDGKMVAEETLLLTEGMTVFDALEKTCRKYGLVMVSGENPGDRSRYVTGIGGLGAGDCGAASGWAFFVNGEMPMDACSDCVLADGDVVSWEYICDFNELWG